MITAVFARFAAIHPLPIGTLNGGILIQTFLESRDSKAALNIYLQLSLLARISHEAAAHRGL
jgi:hypothetical protein